MDGDMQILECPFTEPDDRGRVALIYHPVDGSDPIKSEYMTPDSFTKELRFKQWLPAVRDILKARAQETIRAEEEAIARRKEETLSSAQPPSNPTATVSNDPLQFVSQNYEQSKKQQEQLEEEIRLKTGQLKTVKKTVEGWEKILRSLRDGEDGDIVLPDDDWVRSG